MRRILELSRHYGIFLLATNYDGALNNSGKLTDELLFRKVLVKQDALATLLYHDNYYHVTSHMSNCTGTFFISV